jgi:hypothetical protein
MIDYFEEDGLPRMPPTSTKTFALIDPTELAILRAFVQELAESDPHAGSGEDCLFCDAWSGLEHEPDCVWLRAKEAIKK